MNNRQNVPRGTINEDEIDQLNIKLARMDIAFLEQSIRHRAELQSAAIRKFKTPPTTTCPIPEEADGFIGWAEANGMTDAEAKERIQQHVDERRVARETIEKSYCSFGGRRIELKIEAARALYFQLKEIFEPQAEKAKA